MILSASDKSKIKLKIVEIFIRNVKGKKPDSTKKNKKHNGKDGHWLEEQMGVTHNANNAPDILGYEMKNATQSKTSFGDWNASWYLFKSKFNKESKMSKDNFLKIFGKPNLKKSGRCSWSGDSCPKVNTFNGFGQKLIVDKTKSICAVYDYKQDLRPNKDTIVPIEFRVEIIILAKWEYANLKSKVEEKFNKNGWFKCLQNKDGVYDRICFGEPIDYDKWLQFFKNGDVYFDSGMSQGGSRNRSSWRASNRFWESLITDTYP